MEDYRVRRSLGEHVLRCSVLIAALFIMSLGIALSTKADLGVSPISCTPYVLSLAFPLTMGTVTILMHLSFVAVQAALLKRQFRPAHLLQIPIAFIFGFLTDFSMWIMAPLEPDGYLWSVILCLFSCVVIGFGVFLQVKADSVLLAGEGMSLAFVKLFKWEFGAVKTGMDCTLVCIGLSCSLIFLPGNRDSISIFIFRLERLGTGSVLVISLELQRFFPERQSETSGFQRFLYGIIYIETAQE